MTYLFLGGLKEDCSDMTYLFLGGLKEDCISFLMVYLEVITRIKPLLMLSFKKHSIVDDSSVTGTVDIQRGAKLDITHSPGRF